MTDGAALLRMLEPTVRPVQSPVDQGHNPRATATPARPFEALLSDASQAIGSFASPPDTPPETPPEASPAESANGTPGELVETSAADAPAKQAAPDPLASLGRLDRVENASLRRLMM